MIYVARDLPPADEEGTSDPFVVVRSAGETVKIIYMGLFLWFLKARTSVKTKTLNPGWFETVILDVSLPNLEKLVYIISH